MHSRIEDAPCSRRSLRSRDWDYTEITTATRARAALIARSTVIKAPPICGVAGLPQPDHLWIGAVS
jgi:hypothetical protein